MSAFVTSSSSSAAPGGSGWVAPGSAAAPATPVAHIGAGLVLGVLGAVAVAVGGIGLPVAVAVVTRWHLAGPAQQAALDAALALAPVVLVAGVAHVVAAAGLVLGRGWGRPVGMAVTAAVAIAALVGMALVATGNDPFAAASTNRIAATASGLSFLGFVALAYAALFTVLLVVRRPATAG